MGKSTLFNKLIGKRLSIVDDVSGVTRDRIYGECEWRNKKISLVDTGGIEPFSNDQILSQMRRQAELAIDAADVIVMVVDVKSGVLATDEEVATILKKSGKPVILCVNKCDRIGEPDAEFYEFYNLGIGEPIQVSSVHGHGTGDLLDAIFDRLPDEKQDDEEESDANIAVIGKPNVGKSSLINSISGKERCIVSNVAGTTRDSIDMKVTNNFGTYNFIDTAGIRRKSKINEAIEKYSIIRARLSIERSDVCLIMIDACEGVTEQDTKIAGMAHEAGKASIIVVNKWDAIEKDDKTMTDYRKKIEKEFAFMSYAPMVFISAKTGQRLDRIFVLINHVLNSSTMRISTGMINDLLSQAVSRVQPPTDKGKRLKIYYITQVSVKPPTFVFFVNTAELFHFSYQRYIENCIRSTFGLEGTPIRFIIREKGEKNSRR